MRKAKYIKGVLKDLTPGKVYDVLDIREIFSTFNNSVEIITIINDIGEPFTTYTSLLGNIYFIDVTKK